MSMEHDSKHKADVKDIFDALMSTSLFDFAEIIHEISSLRVDVQELRAEVRMLRGLPPYEAAQK